jgi:hypothetical protein
VPDGCFKYLSLYKFALPVSMYKHLSCAAFKIKLTTGSGNAGTREKNPQPEPDSTPAKSRCVCKRP